MLADDAWLGLASEVAKEASIPRLVSLAALEKMADRSEPTPARIEKLVEELAMNRLLDGQFDESGVTLQEIRAVQDSLVKSVTAHYHGRVKYPSAAVIAEERRQATSA